MKTRSVIEVLALALGVSAAPFATAHAHFKLLAPDSWVVEDDYGAPQKGSPCGPMGYDEPAGGTQYSMKVTTLHAGDKITVDLQETIYHAGYFRIALAANPTDFVDPPLTDNTQCSLDLDSVGTAAHGNVLVDGISKTADQAGMTRHIMQDVTLPATPCDDCTLQVMQVMEDHGPPNCFYYHCAKLKILPADGSSTAGSSASAGASASTAGTGGTAGATTSTTGGSGGATASSTAGKGGSSAGAAGSSTTTTTTTASAGKSGSTTPTSTTTSAQTAASGSAGHSTTPATSGAAGSTPAAAPAEKSGCSVTHVTSTSNGAPAFAIGMLIATVLGARRRQRLQRQR